MITRRHTFTRISADATFVVGLSRIGQARLSDGKLCEAPRTALDILEKKPNNIHDALIAEVAIIDRCTLLTCDKNLARVAEAHGAEVRQFG